MKIPWDRFGARLGVGFCLVGFVFIFLGWNGAASSDRISSQFPYLISGGISGLALVVVGAALIIAQASRDDRARLRGEIESLRATLAQGNGSANGGSPAAAAAPARPGRGGFVAGDTTYHLPSCRLLEGRGDLPFVTREEISNRGLLACRVCDPASSSARKPARRARRA